MTHSAIHINGLPYYPGSVSGPLHKGVKDSHAHHILLITQDQVSGIKQRPAGCIVVDAAAFSHTMIGLLGLGIPTVFISREQATHLHEGMRLFIDGSRGLVCDESSARASSTEAPSVASVCPPATMKDGEPVDLLASVRRASAVVKAKQLGAGSIGLVRSEFIMPEDGSVPDKAFFSRAFGEICEAASSLSLTFRLLDVAADKIPAWLPTTGTPGEALGLQGVRLYHYEPVDKVIDAQLAALRDLSHDYSLRILLPYLVRLEEYDYWLQKVRDYLPGHIPVGAMAETPAMVLDIRTLLAHADFVGIGCNDLMQTLFAADRDQPELRHYLDPYAPVLYRLFKQVAEQAGDHLDRIQLCGVLPQIQGVMPVLLGLGYRRFSVDAPFIPHLAQTISRVSRSDCTQIAQQVCQADTTKRVLEILELTTERHPPFTC